MTPEQTIERLDALKLAGMASVYRRYVEKMPRPDLDTETLVAQMADAEMLQRDTKRTSSRLRHAHFREQVTADQLDFKHPRELSKPLVLQLMGGGWVQQGHNLIITGATGLGKTFLACAIGHRLCQDGRSVLFKRATRLFEDLQAARGDGSYAARLKKLMTTDVLILDDFGMETLDASARHDLLEVMEDRYGIKSTIITSQFEPDQWHLAVGAPTHADSILDRLVHNALRIALKGESIRKTRGKAALTAPENKVR